VAGTAGPIASWLLRAPHLLALYALAVAQPVLGLLGDNAEFFVSRRAAGGDIVGFALLVMFVPPLVIAGIVELVHRANERAGRALHLPVVGLLVAALAIQLLKKLGDWGTVPMLAVAALIGAGGAVAYARASPVRSFVSWLTPVPLLVLVLFLAVSPARRLVFATDVAAAGIRTSTTTPVVMVELDEVSMETLLNADRHIDASAYPNLAQFAGDATVYRRFTAAGDETTRVTSSLLTGQPWDPNKPALPIVANHPRNLFTLLGGAFEMHVSEEASDLCPQSICPRSASTKSSIGDLLLDATVVYAHVVAPPRLEDGLTPTNQTLGRFADDGGRHRRTAVLHNLGDGGRPQRYADWLASVRPSSKPTVYFKHLLLPHVPWEYLPDGRRYSLDPYGNVHGASDEQSFGDPWLLEQAYQRHLLQSGYTDALLGRLFDRLHAQHMYDRALVIITADNGESFLKRGHDRHVADAATGADIASTPLLIKLPGQHTSRYSDLHVRTIDLLPTIADVLDVNIPWKIAGRSFLARSYVPDPQVTLFPQGNNHPPPVVLSMAEYGRQTAATLAAKLRIFGNGMYTNGPDPQLHGRRAPGTAPDSGLRATIDHPERLTHVDTGSTFLPSNITGRLTGANARASLPLAVAVNGRIAATGMSAQLEGVDDVVVSLLVPPQTLHNGSNDVRLYLIAGGRLTAIANLVENLVRHAATAPASPRGCRRTARLPGCSPASLGSSSSGPGA
jgi:Sulfatase